MLCKQRIIIILFSVFCFLTIHSSSDATIFFYSDFESQTCNSGVTWYWENNQGIFSCDGGAYAGSKYLKWHIPQNANNAYTEIPLSGITGNKTYYMAAFFKIKRVNGSNVYMNGADQSFDKFFEFVGTPNIRWIVMLGKHEYDCQPVLNQPNSFNSFVGNSSIELNPSIQCVAYIMNNANGYGRNNPYQVTYDQWHSFVLEVKMGYNNDGYVRQYIDGVKIADYQNINTMTSGTAQILSMKINGTIAQPGYNCPEHERMIDNIIFTDNWQDITSRGYVSGTDTGTGSGSANATPSSPVLH